jgi:hypothetical protein
VAYREETVLQFLQEKGRGVLQFLQEKEKGVLKFF